MTSNVVMRFRRNTAASESCSNDKMSAVGDARSCHETSRHLKRRADGLDRLRTPVGHALETLLAAINGIGELVRQLEAARSIVRHALQNAEATASLADMPEILQARFGESLARIDQVVRGASRHGVNLIDGEDLVVIFSADGTSTLCIQGITARPPGLGLPSIADGNNVTLEGVLVALDQALSTLQVHAVAFGAKVSVLRIRHDFTCRMIETLMTGADQLAAVGNLRERAAMLVHEMNRKPPAGRLN